MILECLRNSKRLGVLRVLRKEGREGGDVDREVSRSRLCKVLVRSREFILRVVGS